MHLERQPMSLHWITPPRSDRAHLQRPQNGPRDVVVAPHLRRCGSGHHRATALTEFRSSRSRARTLPVCPKSAPWLVWREVYPREQNAPLAVHEMHVRQSIPIPCPRQVGSEHTLRRLRWRPAQNSARRYEMMEDRGRQPENAIT